MLRDNDVDRPIRDARPKGIDMLGPTEWRIGDAQGAQSLGVICGEQKVEGGRLCRYRNSVETGLTHCPDATFGGDMADMKTTFDRRCKIDSAIDRFFSKALAEGLPPEAQALIVSGVLNVLLRLRVVEILRPAG